MKKFKTRSILIVLFIFLISVSAVVYIIGRKMDKPPIEKKEVEISIQEDFNYLIDFEDNKNIANNIGISSEVAFSGKYSCKLSTYDTYSSAIVIPVPTNDTSEIKNTKVKFWVNPSSSTIDAVFVFSIMDQNNNQIHWEGFPVKGDAFTPNNWYSFSNEFAFPDKFVNTGYSIKLYLWNVDKNKNAVFIDDISISLKDNNEVESPRSKLVDFESVNDKKISSKYSKSGFYSTYAKGRDDFSATVIIPFEELKTSKLASISISFNYLSEASDLNAVFVVSVCDTAHKDLLWQGIDLSKSGAKEKVWETANGSVIIPDEIAKPGNYIKLYLWNRNDNQVFVDDVYIVIKDKTVGEDSVLPAFNFINEKKYQAKANHPPYDFVYVNLQKTNSNDFNSLNNIFTKSTRILIGKFDNTIFKDQILFSQAGKYKLIYNSKNEFVEKDVTFNCEIEKNAQLYTDHGFVFAGNLETDELSIFLYDKKKNQFVLSGKLLEVDSRKTIAVVSNVDKSFSVFENDGNVLTFVLQQEKYVLKSKTKKVNPNNGNIKFLKADFLNINSSDVLLLYLENDINKYVFLNYDSLNKTWKLSENYKNNSVQSYDKLDFASDYFVIDYNQTGKKELVQFNKNIRFDLKVIEFDIMTYNILYNVEFKGFPAKQNPKYYEVSKIICGDFTGDNCSEIIIFQDNVSRVDWLTQKTEIYSFSKGL
jgi:hypothetical protein